VRLTITPSGGTILEEVDAAGVMRFTIFQPDLPNEPVLVSNVAGEPVCPSCRHWVAG
jgi:hypothetical protein